MDCERQIRLANDDLKGIGTEISIRRRNQKLYLVGTFPLKPGREDQGRHQQEIAIGLDATVSNILVAKSEAIAVSD